VLFHQNSWWLVHRIVVRRLQCCPSCPATVKDSLFAYAGY
jgi:hypothetical protein